MSGGEHFHYMAEDQLMEVRARMKQNLKDPGV